MKLHEAMHHTERDEYPYHLFSSELRLIAEDRVCRTEMRDGNIDPDERRERIKHHQVAILYNTVYREQRELCRDALIIARATASGQALSDIIQAILDSMNCPDPVYMKQP